MTISMPVSSLSSSESLKYAKIDATKTRANSPHFKPGTMTINGAKITIARGDSLKRVVEKINAAQNKTGVKASIEDGRIVLTSKKNTINIADPSGVMADMFKKGQLGIGEKCLVQCVREGSTKQVKINYSGAKKAEQANPLLEQATGIMGDFQKNRSGLHIGGAPVVPVLQGAAIVKNAITGTPLATPHLAELAELIPVLEGGGKVPLVPVIPVKTPLIEDVPVELAELIPQMDLQVLTAAAQQQALVQQQARANLIQQYLLPAQQLSAQAKQTVAESVAQIEQEAALEQIGTANVRASEVKARHAVCEAITENAVDIATEKLSGVMGKGYCESAHKDYLINRIAVALYSGEVTTEILSKQINGLSNTLAQALYNSRDGLFSGGYVNQLHLSQASVDEIVMRIRTSMQ